MLHTENEKIRELLLKGKFGLEKEALRITPDGLFSDTANPFLNEDHIVYDFCENQTEINTDAYPTAAEAVKKLEEYTVYIIKRLNELETPELLWPFSNPPYIRHDDDIPIARLDRSAPYKRIYRECLEKRYGKYKMSLSGIHVNYSFDEELLLWDFKLSVYKDFKEYKDRLYVDLAKNAVIYAWIVTALTAASPVVDSSYLEKHVLGETLFTGMSSLRCSELGYWNYFTPVFDYSDIRAYADSIKKYVDDGLLISPSELYYPIRLKPTGRYDLKRLRDDGADHIEIRTVDLNPYLISGVDERDLEFIRLLIVWMASFKPPYMDIKDQVQAAQNFKNAAHYDLKTVNIVLPGGRSGSAFEMALEILNRMSDYYRSFPAAVHEVIDFETDKILHPEKRYAWRIRKQFAKDFVAKGIEIAKQNALDV